MATLRSDLAAAFAIALLLLLSGISSGGAVHAGPTGLPGRGGSVDSLSVPSVSSGASPSPAKVVGSSGSSPLWTDLTPTFTNRSPPPRISGGMVYDAADGYMLLFGGQYLNSSTLTTDYYNDSWAFENGNWHFLNTSTAPSPREGFGLAYDADDGYVVLFGGHSMRETALHDTWKFSGGVWTNITTSGAPPSRYWASMTYDSTDHDILLFGGVSSTVSYLGDTWTFSGGVWTQQSPGTSPSPREGSGLADDPIAHDAVLFGGLNATSYVNDTWTYAAGTWAPDPNGSPLDSRVAPGFAFDAIAGVDVLFGGYPANFYPYTTWVYDNGSWTAFAEGASTPPDGTVWNQMAYDPATQRVLLVDSSMNATWALNFTGGTSSPPPLTVGASAAPLSGNAPLLVGFYSNVSGGTPPYEFAWTTGDATTLSTENASFTYEASGIYSVNLWVNDSGSQSFHDSWDVEAGGGPLQANAQASPNPATAGAVVTFTSTVSGGTAPYSFSWQLGDSSSSSAQDPTHTYAAAGSYPVAFEVLDAHGAAAFANLTEVVTAAPALAATASATPPSGPAPTQISFTSTAAGGTPPFAFQWEFGYKGATSPLENASYTYSVVGTYTVNLTVTDSVGAHVTQTLTVTAEPPPLGVTITASTTTPSVGENVTFSSIPFGGQAPYTFEWSFGDQGTSAVQNPFHAFGSAATYNVTLTIHDKTGVSASAYVIVVVGAAGTQSSGSTLGLWEIALAVILILGLVLVFVVWRRRRKQPPPPAPAGSPAPPPPIAP